MSARAGLARLIVLAAAVWPLAAHADKAPVEMPWARHTQWMSIRAGYARISAENAPDGLAGYGFGYARFIMDKWSLGAYVHHELLGRFVNATAIEVPMTIEIVRHTRWGPGMHPYFGLGGGAYYYKYSQTGDDFAGFRAGRYVTMGFTSPVARNHLLGVDVRVASVDRPRVPGADSGPSLQDAFVQPLTVTNIGFDAKTETHWSVKLNYAFAY